MVLVAPVLFISPLIVNGVGMWVGVGVGVGVGVWCGVWGVAVGGCGWVLEAKP